MYGSGNGINLYKKANVTTAGPQRLVVMCYEGAISNLKTAQEKYGAGEYEAKAKAVQKVQDILALLVQSLDFEKGGEIARNLNSLYTYMLRRIIEGDLKRDMQAFDEVILMLQELVSAWREIGASSQGVPERGVEEGEPQTRMVLARRARMVAGAY